LYIYKRCAANSSC
jgi:hypothetical protein